jgi:threonine dehydrogenase-like Zn-dependent dehydrogenase
MYQGRTDMESGRILGHENMGRVVEIGKAVTQIKVGDMVCLPFNIGCGHCRNCESSLTAFLSYNESGIRWCCLWFCRNGSLRWRTKYLRVPHGDFNCLKLPEDAVEKQNDYVMLSDVFPQDITQLNWLV